MKPYTPAERQQLQDTLSKSLGPEYLSYRSGAFGRLTYITGGAAVQLANEIFGFDGWSSEIKDSIVDYVDIGQDNKVNVGVSVTMRITLKDGTYREDVGYGASENARNKGSGIEKAKKQATTDAIKRTLRNFGNALGNCMYEKSYLNGITQMGNPQIKFSPANLYRHEQYRPKDTPTYTNPQQSVQSAPVVKPTPTNNIPKQVQQYSKPPNQIQVQAQAQYAQQAQEARAQAPAQSSVQAPAKAESSAQAQARPQAQKKEQPPVQAQQQSLAQKRHQEQVEMQQKRAKQQHHTQTESLVKKESKATCPPLLPEESFSYEGDDEFYAMFQEGDIEDEFLTSNGDFDFDVAAIEELERVSQASSHSTTNIIDPAEAIGA